MSSALRCLWSAIRKNHLDSSVARICIWFGFVHIVWAMLALFDGEGRDIWNLPEYDWVTEIVPIHSWGFIMLASGSMLLWAGLCRKSSSARFGLIVFMAIQWTWGLSYLVWFLNADAPLGVAIPMLQFVSGPVVLLFVLDRSFTQDADLEYLEGAS